MKLNKQNKKVAVIMGSQSDFKIMQEAVKILRVFKIKYEISLEWDTKIQKCIQQGSNLRPRNADQHLKLAT